MTPAELLSSQVPARQLPNKREKQPKFRCSIKAERYKLGLTQLDVSRAVGVNDSDVSGIESGKGLRLDTALKLAKFFGKPVEDLWQLFDPEGVPHGTEADALAVRPAS